MRFRLYSLTRELHSYVGLFLSPFVLVFAVSVILLNHPDLPLGRYSMDAMSASLSFMILSGIYLRYRRTRRILGTTLPLALGMAVLSYFLIF